MVMARPLSIGPWQLSPRCLTRFGARNAGHAAKGGFASRYAPVATKFRNNAMCHRDVPGDCSSISAPAKSLEPLNSQDVVHDEIAGDDAKQGDDEGSSGQFARCTEALASKTAPS
jgi:hypothetical protein